MNRIYTVLLVMVVAFYGSGLLSVAKAGYTNIKIMSATIKGKSIPGVKMIFQKQGESSVEAYTDNNGVLSIPIPFKGADDSSVVLIVQKEGFSSMVVKCPCRDMTYALSSKMRSLDGLRIVLTWKGKPEDLDSHLSFPGNHIYFQMKKGDNAGLDVDEALGYGPETITINRKRYQQRYVYAVHNYSDKKKRYGTRLSNISDAKVFVYIGSTLIKTYYVPYNKPGNTWVVFEIDEKEVIRDINEFIDSDSWIDVGENLERYRKKNDIKKEIVVSRNDVIKSGKINRKGEKAYHRNNLEESVFLYQKAIEINPNNGQAYSNLGLSFRKLNRTAEAIWANRKAVSLADGSKKHIIKASSYYNIARIYEDEGKWNDALIHYRLALQQNERSAYRRGIQRMNLKLNK